MTASGGALNVVVAHDSDTIREALRRYLAEAGYQVTVVADGAAAAKALETRPAALVLDVAVSGVFAYELLEHVRTAGSTTKTILVASVYNRTGYKRRPTSLYGADDYVEQHHIPDQLVPKIERLIGPGRGGARGAAAARDDGAVGAEIRDAGEARLKMRYRTREEGVERARRLARLIIADIALYNGGALATRDETDARLRLDVEEGRLLFDLRVPEEIRAGEDFIGEALAEWYRRETGA
jgi:DNA-binding response OmpR family regulator